MKCEDVEKGLVAYLDRRADSAERKEMEEHLAGCAACRTRAEEFRGVWTALEELPTIEPSFGFDGRVRQRVAAEPRGGWFGWLVPQPRLAFSVALLVALSVWMGKVATNHPGTNGATPSIQQEDFNAIDNLGVLENYDVVTKMDALSELTAPASQTEQPRQNGSPRKDNGGA